MIGADYAAFVTLIMRHWASAKHGHKVLEVLDAYIDAYRNEGVIRGACEDYRAGATIDIDNEKADLVFPKLIRWLSMSRKKGGMSKCRRFCCTVQQIWEDGTI